MPDPFEALRTAPTPIDPDPAFAARLRARVARAIQPDTGEPSMILQTSDATNQVRQGDIELSVAVGTRPGPRRSLLRRCPGLALCRRAELGRPPRRGPIHLARAVPTSRHGAVHESAGVPLHETPTPTAYVVFVVDDIDDAVERVRASGGYGGDVKDQPYGRIAACVDNQGLPFSVQQNAPMPRPPSTGARQGDPAYIVFEFPDASRAREFYGSVLGVRIEPGRRPDTWSVPDIAPMSGLSGGAQRATVVPMFRVDDIAAAVNRVRSAAVQPPSQCMRATASAPSALTTRASGSTSGQL